MHHEKSGAPGRPELLHAMAACPQTPTQSVLDHGYAVLDHLRQLLGSLRSSEPLPGWWRVPEWASTPGLLDLLVPEAVLEEYVIFHDCGKPFCRTVDADGKQHFHDHARISSETWFAFGGDLSAARLMAMDMDAHVLKADGIAEFASRPEAATLLLVALAEVHSNAAMFGGTDSDGFKIKAKHLDKKGRQVVAAIPGLSAITGARP